MSLNGTSESLYGYNTKNKNGELPDADMLKAVIPPIGTYLMWDKMAFSVDSGTTTSTSANHLVQTSQNFLTTCKVGMLVYNSTDATWAYITTINSDTDLTLSADIMTSGENFTIYGIPYLPDGYVEANGQTISDSDSPYNGFAVRNLNGTTDANKYFIRGSLTSGTTGGTTTHNHQVFYHPDLTHGYGYDSSGVANVGLQKVDNFTGTASGWAFETGANSYSSNVTSPLYMEMVFIVRIK